MLTDVVWLLKYVGMSRNVSNHRHRHRDALESAAFSGAYLSRSIGRNPPLGNSCMKNIIGPK